MFLVRGQAEKPLLIFCQITDKGFQYMGVWALCTERCDTLLHTTEGTDQKSVPFLQTPALKRTHFTILTPQKFTQHSSPPLFIQMHLKCSLVFLHSLIVRNCKTNCFAPLHQINLLHTSTLYNPNMYSPVHPNIKSLWYSPLNYKVSTPGQTDTMSRWRSFLASFDCPQL